MLGRMDHIHESVERAARRLFPEGSAAVCAGTIALAFLVYLWTLAPTIGPEDGGELATAAYTMGIPHPTGYPLWCLTAKAFIFVVPVGEVIWRTNMMSAVFGALSAGLVSFVALFMTRSRLAAMSAGLAFAFSREVWEQSVITEIYTISLFYFLLCLLLVLLYEQKRRPYLAYAFALCYGLSLCNHSINVLAGPVFAIYIAVVDWKAQGSLPWRRYAVMAACVCAGLLPYLYLPIRSAADPPMDWGNPETFAGFWDMVTRAQHRFIITGNPRNLTRFLRQCAEFGRIFAWEFTPWVGLLTLVGIGSLWRRDRRHAAFLIVLFLVLALGGIVLPNFSLTFRDIWINTTYWIPAYAVSAVFLAAALAQVSTWARSRAGWMPGLLATAVVCSPLAVHFHHNDMSDYYLSRDYGENLLKTMAQNAIYYGSGDQTLFPALYLQTVEGQRPDILIANPYGYPPPEVYADMPEEARQRLHPSLSQGDIEAIFQWQAQTSPRPLYSTILRSAPGRQAVSEGLLYRYLRPEEESAPDRWAEYDWRGLDIAHVRGQWTSELIYGEYAFARSRWLFAQGETKRAIALMQSAASLNGCGPPMLNNFGTVCAQNGVYEDALAFFESALDIDPGFQLSRLNTGWVYLESGQPAKALAVAEMLLEESPGYSAAETLRSRATTALSGKQ